MKRSDLIQALRDETRLHVDHVVAILDALERVASHRVSSGEPMLLPGIGRLEVRPMPPRLGRNPRTGEPVHVPASQRILFKPTNALRSQVRAGLKKPHQQG